MREIPFNKNNLQVINLFRKVDKFSELSEPELIAFVEVGKLREYQEHEVIIKEGALDCWVYFLISGSLKIFKKKQLIGTLQRCGDMFGEMGVIDGSPRSASIVTQTKSLILGFDASIIEQKLKTKQIDFCYIIYRIFAEVLAVRLRTTTESNVRLTNEVVKLKNALSTVKNISSISKKNVAGNSTMILGTDKKTFINKNILIADSTEATRKILRSLLKHFDCKHIIEAKNGVHALDIMQKESVDLIISDSNLSKLSGLEFLKKVRSNPATDQIPFIMIVGDTDQGVIAHAVEAKVNQCLIKPYNGNTLLAKIKAIMR